MKRQALLKLIGCYLFAAFSMLLLLNTFGRKYTENKLIQRKEDELYKKAQNMMNDYASVFYSTQVSAEEISSSLCRIASFSGVRIWVVNSEGIVIVDSGNTAKGTDLLAKDENFFDKTFIRSTTLGRIFPKPMLAVNSEITSGYQVKGYLCLFVPMDIIKADSIYYTDFSNIVFLIFLAILLLIFAIIYLITVYPVYRLTLIALEYAKGNFKPEVSVKVHGEYRKLLDAINYMGDELKSLDDYQKKFVANISHDFRSPLTSIRGYAKAIQDGTIPYEAQNKYLDIILFEADRLTKLTTNLLELNSFDQKGVMLNIRTFDVNEVIRKTAATFEGYCTKKKIVLELVFCSKETFVDADKDKIQQVFYNLIDNAIKFSNPDSKILVSTEQRGSKVLISVKDHGIGIPKESLKKVWERFYKTDTSRGKDKKGTGLGLSITKEIINAHQEEINVISTVGVGTEFIFSLPLSD